MRTTKTLSVDESINNGQSLIDLARTLEERTESLERELAESERALAKSEFSYDQLANYLTAKLGTKGEHGVFETIDNVAAKLAGLEADKARLDWLEKEPATALWHGEFSDSDFNIKLGRVGAPIFTVSSMDLDGTETDTEMGGGDTLRTAIDEAMRQTNHDRLNAPHPPAEPQRD